MAAVISVQQPANSVADSFVWAVNVPGPQYTSTAGGVLTKFESSLGGLFRLSSGIVVIRAFGISSALKHYLPAAKQRRMQCTMPGTTCVAVGSPLWMLISSWKMLKNETICNFFASGVQQECVLTFVKMPIISPQNNKVLISLKKNKNGSWLFVGRTLAALLRWQWSFSLLLKAVSSELITSIGLYLLGLHGLFLRIISSQWVEPKAFPFSSQVYLRPSKHFMHWNLSWERGDGFFPPSHFKEKIRIYLLSTCNTSTHLIPPDLNAPLLLIALLQSWELRWNKSWYL